METLATSNRQFDSTALYREKELSESMTAAASLAVSSTASSCGEWNPMSSGFSRAVGKNATPPTSKSVTGILNIQRQSSWKWPTTISEVANESTEASPAAKV